MERIMNTMLSLATLRYASVHKSNPDARSPSALPSVYPPLLEAGKRTAVKGYEANANTIRRAANLAEQKTSVPIRKIPGTIYAAAGIMRSRSFLRSKRCNDGFFFALIL